MRRSRKILTEMFVTEATLEFPDGEIDAVNRVLAGAARRGAIPRDALENWPILKGFSPRPAKGADAQKPAGAKPTPKASAPVAKADATPAPDSKSGRVIPATNRFRQPDPEKAAGAAPADPGAKPTPKADKPAGPGMLKRAVSAVRGRDPETGYPKPKSAATKVHGGHGPATSLPRLDRMFGAGDGDEFPEEKTDPEYVSPFAHMGLSGDDSAETDDDPKLAAIKKGLSTARPHAGAKPNLKFPEADAWNGFSGKGGDEPAPPKKQQGRLSRLFKGRRDDDI